ncbi:hypothetical protein GQ457_11G029450 [Hibiscus cannabinus]
MSEAIKQEGTNPIECKGDFGGNVSLLDVQHDMNHGDRVLFMDMVRIELEGLLTICFSYGKYGDLEDVCKCKAPTENGQESDIIDMTVVEPEEKFGPSVQVTNRNPQKNSRSRDAILNNGDGRALHGTGACRYEVLHINEDSHGLLLNDNVVLLRATQCHSKGILAKDSAGKNSASSERQRAKEVVSQEVVVGSKKSGKNGLISGAKGGHGQGASSLRTMHECTSAELTSLNPKNHSVVQVVSRNDEHSRSMVKNIDVIGGETDSIGVGIEREWIMETSHNLVNQQVNYFGNMSVLGVRHAEGDSNIQLKEVVDPNIVALKETGVNGRKVDRIITCHGFPSSYRVETNGFSGGIWILWRHSLSLDVVDVSNQFVHVVCLDRQTEKTLLLSFDDFNVIIISTERIGGSMSRVGVCHKFGAFIQDVSLIDLGFQGLCFTWKRGTLHQQLNRCVSNDAWPYKWIRDGDRNTKFYHLMSKARQCRNNYPMMRLDDDQWSDNPVIIHEGVQKFFLSLFEASSGSLAPWLIANRFEAMTYDEACKLNGEITNNEVKKAIFDMSPLKTLGVDVR